MSPGNPGTWNALVTVLTPTAGAELVKREQESQHCTRNVPDEKLASEHKPGVTE